MGVGGITMKFIGICSLIFMAWFGWQVGGHLSSDALAMAIGVLFGVLAGIPAMLMILASAQRRQPPPSRMHYQPPVEMPRFEVIEDESGRLYSYDSKTGTMMLIEDSKLIEVKR